MFGFGKKKGGRNPSERIQSLSRQGMTEPDIISEMRGEGYKPTEVDRGFRDVLKRAAVPETPRPSPPTGSDWTQRPDLALPPLPGQRRVFKEDEYAPGPAPSAMPGLPPMPTRPQPFGGGDQLEPEDLKDDEEFMDIDDLDEEPQQTGTGRRVRGVPPSPGMVDGRLDRLDNDLEELQERIERIEGRLHSTEQRLPSTDFEKRETEALKLAADSQSKALGEVTMRMEALEKVLKDSLTPMMQTMRSLSDTIKAMKGSRDGL